MMLKPRFRWTWLLPSAMVAITVVLMIVNMKQEAEFWAAHRGLTDTPGEIQQPARLLAELLNGPGFFLSFWIPDMPALGRFYDSGRLFGIAFFWILIGWLLDRRHRGVGTPVIRIRWIRAAFHSLLLLISILLIWAILLSLRSQEMLPTQSLLGVLRALGVRATVLGNYAILIWATGGAAYFGKELVRTIKARPRQSTEICDRHH